MNPRLGNRLCAGTRGGGFTLLFKNIYDLHDTVVDTRPDPC